jgi:hypothetical protein
VLDSSRLKTKLVDISGNIGINNQSNKELPVNLALANDYILAYWKFDEGSGTILEDSSGHDYDGTIIGPTWVSGYTGYALDFDGIDDYIELGPHSEDLGFNKTDDLIFSLYFKSTSSQSGMIYGLAGAGNIPEVRIEHSSSGTIKFRAWTNACGLEVESNDTFNDGSWHHAEIYYNGISSNPTVTLYVDDEFQGGITDWLCLIQSSHFSRAKMGRRGYASSNYYDGAIDEFKIIKYPGGNEQNPPEISGPGEGEPGVEYNYTFITEDPEGDDIWLYIDWDDGTYEEWIGPYGSGEEVIVSHTWEESGKYDIKARSKDIWHHSSWSDTYVVRIGNQAPEPPVISGRKYGDVGVEYEFTFVTEDYEGNDVYYYVDWGDGTHDNWFGPFYSGEEATANHTWYVGDNYGITAKAMDTHDAESEWSDPYWLRIGNEAPYAPDIDGPSDGTIGVKYYYIFNATDPEEDNVSYFIDWGDGNSEWTDFFAPGVPVNMSHTWTEEDTYTITAKAKDVLGDEGPEGTLDVTMPKNKPFIHNIPFLSWLFERFPNIFPILRQVFDI